MTAKAIDWGELRALHCKGVSLKALAKEYNVDYGALRTRASRGKWSNTVAKAGEMVQQAVTEQLAGIAGRHLLKIAGISDLAIDKVAEKLALDPSIDALSKLATVAETFDRIQRRTCGLDAKQDAANTKPVTLAVNVAIAGAGLTAGTLGKVLDVESEIVGEQPASDPDK